MPKADALTKNTSSLNFAVAVATGVAVGEVVLSGAMVTSFGARLSIWTLRGSEASLVLAATSVTLTVIK